MTATTPNVPRHPAKFSDPILDVLADVLEHEQERQQRALRVLDPFAGTGKIHSLAHAHLMTFGVELEPEWAAAHPGTLVGNALELSSIWPLRWFDAIVTSPCYGNRMADHHEARDDSRRNTYRHALGRPLTAGSAAAMQWGPAYREFHRQAWTEALRVLRPGGLMVVNCSNHIRKGEEQFVNEWHLGTIAELGCTFQAWHPIKTRRNKQGANAHLRVDREVVMVLRKEEAA